MFVPFAENPQPKWYIGAKHTDKFMQNKNPALSSGIFLFSLPYQGRWILSAGQKTEGWKLDRNIKTVTFLFFKLMQGGSLLTSFFMVDIFFLKWYIKFATQFLYIKLLKCVFLSSGKNIRSIFAYFFSLVKNCVAAIGAVYFSVRSFGCALF